VKEFRPGDKVVLPPYGVGVVAGIAQRSISGVSRAYYQVDFPGSRSKAYVPVEGPPERRHAQGPLPRGGPGDPGPP
jgi:CarD family transcriptional regulator